MVLRSRYGKMSCSMRQLRQPGKFPGYRKADDVAQPLISTAHLVLDHVPDDPASRFAVSKAVELCAVRMIVQDLMQHAT